MPDNYMMDDLKNRLQAGQHKMTPQRKIVLQVFLDHPGEHLSAEEVHDILRSHDLDIGLATVYRSLELLHEIHILQKMDFGDGRSRYEVKDTNAEGHQHHHLICLKCGKVTEFSDDMLEELEQNIMDKCQFKILDHQVKFFGYCRECANKD